MNAIYPGAALKPATRPMRKNTLSVAIDYALALWSMQLQDGQ